MQFTFVSKANKLTQWINHCFWHCFRLVQKSCSARDCSSRCMSLGGAFTYRCIYALSLPGVKCPNTQTHTHIHNLKVVFCHPAHAKSPTARRRRTRRAGNHASNAMKTDFIGLVLQHIRVISHMVNHIIADALFWSGAHWKCMIPWNCNFFTPGIYDV